MHVDNVNEVEDNVGAEYDDEIASNVSDDEDECAENYDKTDSKVEDDDEVAENNDGNDSKVNDDESEESDDENDSQVNNYYNDHMDNDFDDNVYDTDDHNCISLV